MDKMLDPNQGLRKLHGARASEEDSSRDMVRNIVLLVCPDPEVQAVVTRILKPLFSDFIFRHADTIDQISGTDGQEDIRDQLALVIVDLNRAQTHKEVLNVLRCASASIPLVHVPLVVTSSNLNERDLLEIVGDPDGDSKRDSVAVDGFLKKPYSKDSAARELSFAIMRRTNAFSELEAVARRNVLKDFTDGYLNLVSQWQESIYDISFYPLDREDQAVDPSKEYDLVTVFNEITKLKELFKKLGKLDADSSDEDLRKIVHDMNNCLTVISSFLMFVKDDKTIGKSDSKILSIIFDEVNQLIAHINAIRAAYNPNNPATWSSVAHGEMLPDSRQILEFPKGTVFCVVDDSKNILQGCSRLIERNGGKAYTARDVASLLKILDEHKRGIDVVLLDNDLGGGLYGHQLVALILARFPHAVIIGHTSEADILNSSSENLYKKLGVPVVNKRAWNDVSTYIAFGLGQRG